MPNMVPVIVDEKNIGFIGVMIIILSVYILYTITSMYLSELRYNKLLRVKALIEEGHNKKMQEKYFSEREEKQQGEK